MKSEQWSLNEFGWRSENLTRFEVLDQDGKQVCEIKALSSGRVPERAHLIAASPELLESCKALLDAAPETGEGEKRAKACAMARLAIAKAEGK